jgi:hypothetical protein
MSENKENSTHVTLDFYQSTTHNLDYLSAYFGTIQVVRYASLEIDNTMAEGR